MSKEPGALQVAKSAPMRTGFEAMRIGTVIYFIPFFFVFNPALLGQGSAGEIVIVVVAATAGVLLVAAALQGYLIGLGTLGAGMMGWAARGLLGAGGLVLAAPGGGMIDWSHLELAGLAAVLIAPGIILGRLARRSQPVTE